MFKTTPTFPAELIARCQWVGWKYVARKHKPKPGKVPYNPKRGVKAKSNNPTTWGTLEEAIRLCRIFHMDGFGFVFSPNDPYCGVDLDGCRDPETGTIEPWAGVHIIIRGTLPPGNHKKPYGGGTVEAYDTGRFFTMTGEHLEGTPLSIENRETELQAFHARYLGEEKCSKGESTKAGHQPTHPPNCTQSSAEGLSDDQIIVRASCAANGDRFNDLFW